MWFILVFTNILLVATATTNGPRLIKFNEETLIKLRLSPTSLSNVEPYVEYELLNEYQCAIECIKDQSMCTGYVYDPVSKICSLFDHANKIIDADITRIVCIFYLMEIILFFFL
jgi:hypothetical protein